MIMKAGKTLGKAALPKKKSGFVYKKRDPKTVRARAEQSGGKYDSIFKSGFDTYTAKAGDNCIRFLPPTWEDHEHYGLDIWVHGYIGNGSYLCPAKMLNKRCPICEASAESAEAGETDEAKKLEPNRRVLTWVLDRDGDSKTPQLYSMSWSMDKDISTLADNKRSGEVLLIDHPDEGYDVSFKRTGQKLATRYVGTAIDRSPSPLSDRQKEQDKLLEFLEENPLPSVLNYKSADFLEKVIAGTAEEKDEDLDEEEDEGGEEEKTSKTKKKSTRVALKKKSRDEDEEEDENEDEPPFDTDEEDVSDEDADEDEEEEKPSKKVKKKPARDEDEDEEEEEETPDDEEDEEPEEEEEEEEEPGKPKAKVKRKPAARDEEEEDEDDGEEAEEESDEEDEEDEEEEPPRRRVKPAAKKGRR